MMNFMFVDLWEGTGTELWSFWLRNHRKRTARRRVFFFLVGQGIQTYLYDDG